MKHFQNYAVVFVFVIACNYIAHGIHISDINLNNYHWESMMDVQTYDPKLYHIEYIEGLNDLHIRRKRGFFSMKIPTSFIESADSGKKETVADSTITISDADTDSTISAVTTKIALDIGTAYRNFLNSAQPEMTHIVSIGPDVKRTLVEAAPYMPLVNKVATHIVPDLSQRDVLMLSVNVAALTTQGINNYLSTKVTESPTKPDVGATISHYATGFFNKLKGAFKSHFGDVSDNSSEDKKTKSSEETDGIFDKVKSHINYFRSFMSRYDVPKAENNENQIETIVTQMSIEDSQTPTSDMIITKTFENGVESIQQTITDEAKHVLLSNKLLQSGKNNVEKMITDMKSECNSKEDSENESDEYYDDNDDIEAYDNDHDNGSTSNDNNENTMDYDVKVNEEDFNKVMRESMALQPDFVQTLDGEELLKIIEEFQKTLPNPNTNDRKIFEALIEELDIDQRVGSGQVNELIDGLDKTTNYFISSALKKNENLTTPPTLPEN